MVQVMMRVRKCIAALLGVTFLTGVGSAMSAEDAELEAQFREGMEALNDDRLKSAIRAFSRILDTEPELHRARLELALAYHRSMRYEDAEKLAQEVLDDPNTPPEVRVTVLAFLAQVKR
ncbi:MAG: tetratricopeptide repeat protein, partial [Thiogranum sp.]